MDALQRSDLIERYRRTRCDRLVDGRWRSIDTLPEKPVFLLSAWNPDGVAASPDENTRHDAALREQLERQGWHPQRIRGRSISGDEEGWLIPYLHAECSTLLRRFHQRAGIIWDQRGRRLLWSDGLISQLDGDRCEIPDEDAT